MNNEVKIDFIKNRKIFLIISACIIVLGLLVNIIFGVEMDVTFKGGTLISYSYEGELKGNDVAAFFTEKIGEKATAELTNSGATKILNIYSTKVITNEQSQEIHAAFEEAYAANAVKQVKSNNIAASHGMLFFAKCMTALVLAGIFLVIYVGLRFRRIGGLSAALMSIAALIHDLAMVYFAFVIFRIPLNDNFVAVMLAVLGYSLNDTIVIYDRIRENRRRMNGKASINEIVNLSLNQSFRRTMNTTVTTLIVVATLVVVALALNIEPIISFSVPMMFGVVSGFYSSTFLCAPVWAAWVSRKEK